MKTGNYLYGQLQTPAEEEIETVRATIKMLTIK
jgi:hypothetical protein